MWPFVGAAGEVVAGPDGTRGMPLAFGAFGTDGFSSIAVTATPNPDMSINMNAPLPWTSAAVDTSRIPGRDS